MTQNRMEKAKELMQLLNALPQVHSCTLYGSLAANGGDALSDIDIALDVSGCDNGAFALVLPQLLGEKLPVLYSDYAPSLAPEKYVVSVALDENDPFLIVDLCCTATPHCTAVTRQQLNERNDRCTHILKLWIANLKHFARGVDNRTDILHMTKKLGLGMQNQSSAELLGETLQWLEKNAPSRLYGLLVSCRKVFTSLCR